jgi:hypothetical protein
LLKDLFFAALSLLDGFMVVVKLSGLLGCVFEPQKKPATLGLLFVQAKMASESNYSCNLNLKQQI